MTSRWDAEAALPGRDGPEPDGCGTERFAVEVRPVTGAVVVALSGELDYDTADPLRAALEGALAGAGPTRLVVDCAGLRFCDSTGLNVLLRARLAARATGGSVELAEVPDQAARLFRVTGADQVFPVHTDVDAALSGSGAAPS
ncbi:STAS domain-containing protein [Streptomyces sp. NPDC089799]|uniref:STAS domain-containing protein n=1 Tax=Streptomyces sp. NPDC089799 TaxID=3155066 RepID=UPI00342963C2